MGRVLASTVAVFDPAEGRTVALAKGTALPDWAVDLVHESRLVDESTDVRGAVDALQDVEPAEVTVASSSVPSLENMTKADLVAEANARGVDDSGTKADLLERLQGFEV